MQTILLTEDKYNLVDLCLFAKTYNVEIDVMIDADVIRVDITPRSNDDVRLP